MSMTRKRSILCLFVSAIAAVALTWVVADEGLSIYVGYIGLILLGVPSVIVAVVLLFKRHYTAAAIALSISVFFLILTALAPLGLYLRHRRNIAHAKSLCETLAQVLEEQKKTLGEYPVVWPSDLLVNDPYAWMLGHDRYWEVNVSIDYSGDAKSFSFLVCPPISEKHSSPLADRMIGYLPAFRFTNQQPRWLKETPDACRRRGPAGQ